MTDDLLKVRSNIYLGEYDEHLDELIESIRDRKKVLAEKLFNKLAPGSLVRFTENARPKYIIGVPATITRRREKKVEVKLGQDVGRFNKGVPIVVDPQILELIEPPSFDE